MSHSEEKEPNSEEQEVEEDSAPVKGKAEVADEEPVEVTKEVKETEDPAQAQVSDHRLARLMKMRSQYVTEETLRSTEESSKPKPPPPSEDDEEFLDDEEYYDDEEYDEHYDEEYDDFEDDDYEDEQLKPKEAAVAPTESKSESEEADSEEEDEEDLDHRVAQLRKLNKTFVSEKDLDIKVDPDKKVEVFKETQVQKVVCPNCQSEETRGQKICAQCGAKLPKLLVEEEKYNPGTLNKAVMKYYDAVRQLRAETWSIEQFTDFLHDRYDLSKAQIDGLHELIEECGSQEWLPGATSLIKESTDLLETAILIMIDKVNETVAGHVDFDPDDYPLEDAKGNPIDYPFEDEDGNTIEFPMTLEDRILEIDFQPELEDIKRANGMMLETLKKIDDFQKQAQDDLEVSM